MRSPVPGAQGQRGTGEEPMARAVTSRAVNTGSQAEEAGFLAWGLQVDFRPSMNMVAQTSS